MVIGTNTVFEHEGKKYHLQAEDLGTEAAAYEVRVYDQGSVVWHEADAPTATWRPRTCPSGSTTRPCGR